MINQKEKEIIRKLAKKVADIAELPIMSERRERWKRHNRLERAKPMILVFPEGAWHELIYILALSVIIGIFILNFTKFGRHVYAIGGNELASKVSGLKVGATKIWVYAIAGVLAGAAGVILSSRVMAGSPVAGQGYELDAIAAVVIGGTSLSGGVGSIAGTIIGALIRGRKQGALLVINRDFNRTEKSTPESSFKCSNIRRFK